MKWKIASKILGGATAATLLYNAHYAGNFKSKEHIATRTAERMNHFYLPTRRMDEMSITTSKLKDKWFQTTMDWNLPNAFNAVIGYAKGAFSQLSNDIIPATLATGALLSKRFDKVFAIGLLAYGVKYLICDIMGLGKMNHLK